MIWIAGNRQTDRSAFLGAVSDDNAGQKLSLVNRLAANGNVKADRKLRQAATGRPSLSRKTSCPKTEEHSDESEGLSGNHLNADGVVILKPFLCATNISCITTQ